MMIANLTMRHFFTRGLVQIVEYGSTRMIFAILIVCLLGYSTPSSATSPNNSINDIYVVLFVLDGGNYKYFDSLIKKGKLPNLKKYFYDEGAYFEKAITSFPTCSAPNYQGMITGLYPGESGVNYLGWFDRKNEKKYDYLTIKHVLRPNLDLFNTHAIINGNGNENHPITLFEVLDGYPTASIYSPITKGASRRSPKVPIGAIFNSLTGNELKLDKSALKYLYRSFVKDPDDIPRFTLIGLYGTDSSGHHYGTTSEEVELIYKHFDSFIDKFVTLLKKKDIYDKTYLVMVSDHGIHDISNTTRLDRDLWNEGFHVKYGNPRKSKGYNLLVMERGIASAQIYVRGNNGWRDIPDINYLTNLPTKSEKKNLIYFLRNHPAIDITAVFEDSNTTKVFSQNAEATIKYRLNNGDLEILYQPMDYKNDPLKYNDSLYNQYGGTEWWAKATIGTQYPDAVTQLAQIFLDGKSGNIWVSTKREWGLVRKKLATHGSLLNDDMRVIFALHGPGVPYKKFGFARLIDLYPTMLEWYGIKSDPKNYSGKKLFK